MMTVMGVILMILCMVDERRIHVEIDIYNKCFSALAFDFDIDIDNFTFKISI